MAVNYSESSGQLRPDFKDQKQNIREQKYISFAEYTEICSVLLHSGDFV